MLELVQCLDLGVVLNAKWSEEPEYNLSDGRDPTTSEGGMIDQFGCYWPPEERNK